MSEPESKLLDTETDGSTVFTPASSSTFVFDALEL
jgi:hypothetical protein